MVVSVYGYNNTNAYIYPYAFAFQILISRGDPLIPVEVAFGYLLDSFTGHFRAHSRLYYVSEHPVVWLISVSNMTV